MKRKAPQFLIRYANNKIDRLYDSGKDCEAMELASECIKKVNFAVFDYEYGVIEIDDAMMAIAEI